MKPRVLLPLLVMFWMCLSHVKFSVIVTPKVAAGFFCLQYMLDYVHAACTQIVVPSCSLELYIGLCIWRA